MKQYLWVEDNFSSSAKPLRAAFDERFADPKRTDSRRFVWDFWHVPEQYTLVRTPADQFFPRAPYESFLRDLGAWGARTLGCASITPPWLSYYVNGCEQKLHSDVPHGPWAFVFSLSPPRGFRGGETLILRPEVLNYWSGFTDAADRELHSFVNLVRPSFNRLVVFDPRIPHGVTRVEGSMDPREARLVLHGWFSDPRPYLEGALSARQVAPALDDAVARAQERLDGAWHGMLSVRVDVGAAGNVRSMRLLADSLVRVDGGTTGIEKFRVALFRALREIRFPKAKAGTRITLPLLFR